MTSYWMLANQTINTHSNKKKIIVFTIYLLNKIEKFGWKKSKGGPLYIFCPGLYWVKDGKPGYPWFS
jgi:hypothetical protein